MEALSSPSVADEVVGSSHAPVSDLRPMNMEVGRATGGFVPSWAGPGEGFSFVLAILFLFYLFPLFCFLLLFYF